MEATSEVEVHDDSDKTLSVEQGIYHDLQLFAKRLFSDGADAAMQGASEFSIQKGTSLSMILERLSSLADASTVSCSRKHPDVYNLVSVLSLSIRGYLMLAPKVEIASLADRVHADSVMWLSQLFRYENGNGCFHENRLDGLLKVAKLALYLKYAKYATDGFTALYTRPPVIYISAAAPPSLGKDLKTHLGLPQSSICTVPCNSMFGSSYTMDVAAFERLLTDDVSCGKTPLLLIGYAGTPLAGHTDNLSRLREVCTQSGVWFHVEGDTLTTLSLAQVPSPVSAATNADSVTLDLGTWFGMHSQPHCTLFRTSNVEVASSVGLISTEPLEKLHCLPLWVTFQFMGTEDLQKIIGHASEISQQLADRVDAVNGLKRVEQVNTVSPVVIFKYKASPELRSDSVSSQEDEVEGSSQEILAGKSNQSGLNPAVTLNIPPQMTDELNRLILKEVNEERILDTVTLMREGLCIKFNPYPACKEKSITKDDINKLIEKLETLILQLDSSLVARSEFEEAIKKAPNVLVVDTGMSPCIGAFQCIPKYWKTTNVSNLSDSKKREINSLNSDVIDRLSEKYPSLVLMKNSTEQHYILIGFSRSTLDLTQFVIDLTTCLDEVEDNSIFIESVSEAVQKSIMEAEERLHKEAEEKLLEGGILRLVPVVGSLYNWLSPPPKDDLGVTGRSFQIKKGKVETTENTYRLKMQVTDDGEDDGADISHGDTTLGSIPLDQSLESLDEGEQSIEPEPEQFNEQVEELSKDPVAEQSREVDVAPLSTEGSKSEVQADVNIGGGECEEISESVAEMEEVKEESEVVVEATVDQETIGGTEEEKVVTGENVVVADNIEQEGKEDNEEKEDIPESEV